MKVNSKFTINKIRLKQLSTAAVRSLINTVQELQRDVRDSSVIPRYNNTTANEGFFPDYKDVQKGIIRLVHSTPYARRIYYNPDGFKFHKEKWTDVHGDGKEHDGNANAKDHWFDDWLPGGSKQDFCAKAFKRLYRRNAGLK